MSNSFYHIFRFIQKYRIAVLLGSVLFLVFSAWVIKRITFNEDITKVIPRDNATAAANNIIQQMSFTDKIAVIFSKTDSASNEDLTDAAQSFLDTLSHFQNYYYNVQGVLDEDLFQKSFRFVNNHLPIYLHEEDYPIILSKLDPDSITSQITRNYETLTGNAVPFMKDVIVQDPLQLSFLALKKLHHFQGSEDYVFEDGYLFSKDHDRVFLFINPKYSGSETKHNELFVDALRAIQHDLNTTYPQVETSYFGAPFIAVANAKQIKHDILTTVAISVTALMLLLVFYYRNWLVPIIVMIPTVFGGLFGILCLYFIKSEISAISLSISAILIGITIDYALHFLTHSKNNQNIRQLFDDVSRPLLMSSSTTAVAFLCLLFVRSEALVDLGIFASIAVVATAIFTLVILPHVYRGKPIKHTHLIDKIATYPFEKNKLLIGISLLLVIVSIFTYHQVAFDGDLSKINYIPEDQKNAEKSLYDNGNTVKNLFVAIYGHDEDEVLQRNENILGELDNDPNVIHAQSISQLIPSLEHQKQAIQRWNNFWNAERVKRTISQIEKQSTEAGFVENTHQPFYRALTSNYTTITLDSLRVFDEQIYREFVHGSSNNHILSTVVSLDPDKRDSFVQKFEEKHADQQVLIIDRQALNEQYLGYLIHDFNSLVGYSFIAVYLILFLFYRRIELVIVASIPIALTGFITAGIMGLLHIPFNIFSTIVCTLVFGHGIDFTIFMTSALQKQYTYGKDEMPIYRTSIILAVLTTILAIGALIFARHPALKSISAIALIGVSVAVLVTFVLYPILYKFFFFNRIKKGLSPVNLRLLIQSIFLFAYFALASIFASLLMRSIFWLLPLSKTKRNHLFGKWMSWYMTSVLYLKPQTKKRIYHKENLHKCRQAVIIANHTSFLDSLSMAMLHPDIVFLVNDWVYNSPVFGRAVRFLGFLPTSLGLENQIGKLRERIGQSFSVAVFPEGTRSFTSEVKRFHKGAFYLSQQFELPILPVYLHGNADTLPKGDFIIYDNFCDIHVGEPIWPSDTRFGKDYNQRTKAISRYYKETFKHIRLKAEDEHYFRQKLFLNYLYKEYAIGKKVKADFAKHKSTYHQLFRLINDKANIAHVTADYGQVDFFVVSQFPSRKLTTYNIMEEHRDISRSSYIVNKYHIRYVDHLDQVWNKQEVLVLSHLSEFDRPIPDHIKQIVLVCCSFEQDFVDFHKTIDNTTLKCYQRNETKETI